MRHHFFFFFFFWLLAFQKKKQAHTHPGFLLQSVTSFHWPGLPHYYGTIRHLAALRFGFPFRLYRPYLIRVCVKETTRLPSVICIFCSIHPDPNHVDESYRSFPFVCFPVGYTLSRIGFPVLWAGRPASPPPLVHCIPGWILPAGPSDSSSRKTPCPSVYLRLTDVCFGYGTLKGKVTGWI